MSLVLLLLVSAEAHKPSYGGDWSGPSTAFEVADPDVSIVVYREISCESPELWLTFDATAGEEVWVQVGVPVIDRLEDYRPSMAVVGPGLPEIDAADVPFEIPAGLGAVVYPGSSEPDVFFEPFTGTESWIISEDWITMPDSGKSYLVAWDPGAQTGKLWLAMGVVEDFSDVDWTEAADWGVDVNNFHETGAYEEVSNIEEQVCLLDEDGDDHVHGDHDHDEAKGCATSGSSPMGGVLGVLLAAAAARRRQGL